MRCGCSADPNPYTTWTSWSPNLTRRRRRPPWRRLDSHRAHPRGLAVQGMCRRRLRHRCPASAQRRAGRRRDDSVRRGVRRARDQDAGTCADLRADRETEFAQRAPLRFLIAGARRARGPRTTRLAPVRPRPRTTTSRRRSCSSPTASASRLMASRRKVSCFRGVSGVSRLSRGEVARRSRCATRPPPVPPRAARGLRSRNRPWRSRTPSVRGRRRRR